MNPKQALNIIEKIMRSSRTVIVEIKKKHYKEALRLSTLSGAEMLNCSVLYGSVLLCFV